MSDVPIPPEAVEALREELRMSRLCADPATARAAILAMLKAWPGRQWHEHLVVRDNGEGHALKRTGIILPLTQENRDE